MNVPVFIEIEVEEQAEELRAYFKGLGAEISLERSDKGFEDDLHKIIGVCDACFKETNVKDVQGVRTFVIFSKIAFEVFLIATTIYISPAFFLSRLF